MSSNQSFKGRGGFRGGSSGGQRGGGAYRGSAQRGGGDQRGSGNTRGRGGQSGGQAYSAGGDHRGGGGQRGGRRPQSPIRSNVRELCESVETKAVAKNRPNRGKEGKAVELIVNHYRIQFSDSRFHHYDIEIRLRRFDGNGYIAIVGPQERKLRKERQMENIRVIEQMARDWPQVFAPNTGSIAYVFDGQKNLYCAQKLSGIGSEAVARDVTILLDGYSEQTFEVRIKFVKEISMNAINEYFNRRLSNPGLEDFREALQVLDIVLRYRPQQTRVPLGRNLFSREARDRIDIPRENALIAFGHHQSLQMTECGLTLNVDRTATLFRSGAGSTEKEVVIGGQRFKSAGTLVQFIQTELGVRDLSNTLFTPEVIRRLNPKLKGLKIFTTHIKIGQMVQKRNKNIESMIELKPSEQHFQSETGDTTIEAYFQTKYKITLQYRNIPCIQLKGGQPGSRPYLPVEICHVYPDQPVPKRLMTTEMQKQIVETSNSQTPLKRFDTIQQSMVAINTESQDLIPDFGLTLSLKPIKLMGRELPAPTLTGNSRVLSKPRELTNYLFYNLSDKVHPNWETHFQTFFNNPEVGLIQTARGMRFPISAINLSQRPLRAMSGPFKNMGTIESAVKRAERDFKGIQMIFFCIPKSQDLYYPIKYFGDIRFGIPTQCILDDNFMRTPRGYFNNIVLKINAKLDGQNQCLIPAHRPDEFTKAGNNQTMIVGVDVTHPGTNPLANERVISSIASVVGSYDSEFTKYVSSVSAQPMNTEIISNFDVMFGQLLRQFFKNNGKRYPKSIVLFRDGVSDSQFPAVMAEEIPLILKAYTTNRVGFVPKVTVFVVQKRHHTRIIPMRPERDQKGNEIRNINAGTVVDHTIVNPLYDDFHLCSHKGLLGTSRHAKYVVLRDDHNLTADQKQKLSYYLCYAYNRCTTPISIPAPVMYAHLCAFRAKLHAGAQNIEYENLADGQDESEDQQRERERRNINKLNDGMKVHPKQEILPYYC